MSASAGYQPEPENPAEDEGVGEEAPVHEQQQQQQNIVVTEMPTHDEPVVALSHPPPRSRLHRAEGARKPLSHATCAGVAVSVGAGLAVGVGVALAVLKPKYLCRKPKGCASDTKQCPPKLCPLRVTLVSLGTGVVASAITYGVMRLANRRR